MPNVLGKKFPYTPEGLKAAKEAMIEAMKEKKKKEGEPMLMPSEMKPE